MNSWTHCTIYDCYLFILPEKIMNVLWINHWTLCTVKFKSAIKKRERDFMPWLRWDSICHYLSAVSPKGHVVMSLLWGDGRILRNERKLINWACVLEGTSGPSPFLPLFVSRLSQESSFASWCLAPHHNAWPHHETWVTKPLDLWVRIYLSYLQVSALSQ